MSIIVEASSLSPTGWLLALLWSLPAIWIVARRSVVLAERDACLPEPALLLVPAFFGFVVWLVVPGMILAAMVAAGETGAFPASASASATTAAPAPPDATTRVLLALLAPLPPMLLLLLLDAFPRPGLHHRIGLGGRGWWRGLRIGLLATPLVLPVVLLASQATQWLWAELGLEHERAHSLLQAMEDAGSRLRLGAVVAAVVVAPLFEELLFRGHLQSGIVAALRPALGSRSARWLAILVASLAFALIHEWWTQPIIFVLSVCIGWLYERSGNLWAAIVLHGAFNAVSTTLFMFAAT